MNSIKAFFKEKGLYLVCLALVFAATVAGIAAIRSVVRGVEDLTRIKKQELQEGNVWDSPDTAVDQPAQDVPVTTAQPTPSAAPSAQSSSLPGDAPSAAASGGTGSSAGQSGRGSGSPRTGLNGETLAAFSGDELVYSATLGDWRTHNGTDYAAGDAVAAVQSGTVTAVLDDALWGRTVEVTDAAQRVWRYCGMGAVQVTQNEAVAAGQTLGTVGTVPAEAQLGSHLHLECVSSGRCVDPELGE